MKKFTTLLILLFNISLFTQAQEYIRKRQQQNANFYEVQKSFNELWKDKEYEKGNGFKQYKRWEYLMEQRVGSDGKIPNIGAGWLIKREYEKQQKAVGRQFRSTFNPNWNSLGPASWTNGNSGYNPGNGRLTCIYAHPNDPNTLFVGTPAGGLWRSTNGGNEWTPLTDNLSVLGIADIVINPVNSDIMYIATGDNDGGSTSSIGVLKSTDGGNTWNTTGLSANITDNWKIYKMLMHPEDPNTIIVAGNIGIYKTTNGGDNWNQINSSENFCDLIFKPGDPSTIYASTIYGNNLFYKSTNSGDSFSPVTSGLPTSDVSRVVIGVTPANPDYVYLLMANNSSSFKGVYRSEDSGDSFSMRANSPNLLGYSQTGSDNSGQGTYDLCIAVSPVDAETIFTGGIQIWKSTNGGTSYNLNTYWVYNSAFGYVHADVHTMEYVGNTLYSGSDGGIFRSNDHGSNWTDLSIGIEIMQFYRIGGLEDNPDLVIGGAQDNGGNLYRAGEGWTHVYGADGMEALIDYSNNDIMYETVQFGVIQRSTNAGASFTNISPSGAGSGGWVTPYSIDPQTPTTLYAGYGDVWKTTNRGNSWTKISSLGAGTLRSLEVAPSNPNYIYTATYSAIFVTKDGGDSWTNIKSGLPSQSITYIETDPTNPERVWVTFSGYSSNNKIYYSNDAGENWTNITENLPNLPANCVTFQKESPNRIYVGTDVGIYYRDDNTDGWLSFSEGLPNVIVNELEINYSDNKLRAGTFGRGLWEADLLTDLPTTFTDVANAKGLDFSYGSGLMGGGASFADFNGDGWDDISISTQTGQTVGLFSNNQQGFSITQLNDLNNLTTENKHISWVDYDNDGDKDVFITSHNDGSNKLFNNDGYNNFTDVTVASGIITDEMPTFGAAWGDINNDGWLDLYITNRSGAGEAHFNYLYKNNGDGTFTDITISAGVKDENNLPFLAGFLDINNDGWLDIYIPQDKQNQNVLFKNNGDETFTDISTSSGADLIMDAMSISVGDYDNNGFLDIYMTNTQSGNKLLRNNGDETFTEMSDAAGVSYNGVGWGSNFVDYDNDGDLDIFGVGSLEREPSNLSMFENDGSGHFTEKTGIGFDGIHTDSYGMAMGDHNQDGYYDFLVVSESPDKVQLWESSGNTNNWIKIRLQGTHSNREGLGNWIFVYADGQKYTRYTTLETSFVSQNSSDIIIGVGGNTEIDSIEVNWLGGNIDKLYDISVNQKLTIIESNTNSPLMFTNVAVEKGINSTYGEGYQGGGITFTDFDNDGLDDIAVPRGKDLTTSFYKNNGNGFDSLAVPTPLIDVTDTSKQLLWADYDNDGDQDLFKVNFGSGNKLYRNNGNFTFSDVTEATGIITPNLFSFGAAWGDINNDGHLDLYITDWGEDQNPNTQNYLFKNNGDGTFTDITISSGTKDDNDKLPLVPSFLDINNDGLLDIYIAQDRRKKNTLLKNNGDETFTDISISSGANIEMDGMSVAIGDYDKNGYLDMYISNIPNSEHISTGGNRLLRNNGDETFTDVTTEAGVGFEAIGWGGNFVDYDNDGDLDIFTVGASEREGANEVLYENDGNGVFTENTSLGFAGIQTESYGTAMGDYNQDGFYDFVVSNYSPDKIELWENSGNNNNWIKISLEGVLSNRDGFGSWINVYAGGEKYTSYAPNAVSFTSQNSSDLIVGIGNNTTIDSIYVTWLSGAINRIYNPEVNQTLHIIENNNVPPVFNSSPILEVEEGTLYTYDIEIEDVNGDALTLNTVELPNWLSLNNGPNGFSLSGTPGAGDIGKHTVILSVSDGQETATQSFQITVTAEPINKPSGLSATVLSAKKIAFTWNDNSHNETSFELQRSTNIAFGSYTTKTISANEESYIDENLIPNFQYHYRLRAVNTNTISDFSEMVSATTLDSIYAPNNLQVISFTHDKVSLSWNDNADNEDNFQLHYATNEDFTDEQVITIDADLETYTCPSLNRNTIYYFKLKAINSNTSSVFTEAINQQTADFVETPSGLSATQVDNQSIKVEWLDNSDFESGYELQRALSDDFTEAITINLESNTTNYIDNGLTFNTTYFYRVRGFNTNVNSEFSGTTNEIVTDFIQIPSEINGVALSHTSLKIQWADNSDNETGFELQRSLTNDFASPTTFNLASDITEYTDEDLSIFTTYFYRIRGINDHVNSDYSTMLSLTTNDFIVAPSGLEVSEFTDTEVSLSWTDNSDNETGFAITRSTDQDFTNLITVTTTNANTISFTDTELKDNTTYYYKVHAVNDNTSSEYTDVVNTTTLITGLNLNEIKGGVTIFPNPFAEKISIRLKNQELGRIVINLMGISGKQLKRFIFEKKSSAFEKSIELQLNKGIYLLEIIQGKNRTIKKILRN